MSRAHTIVAFIAEVRPDRKEELENLLQEVAGDPAGNAVLPFAHFSGVHFASLNVCERENSGPRPPVDLIFEVNCDDDYGSLVDTLDATGGPGLRSILSCCFGYHPESPTAARDFLVRKAHFPNAWHAGNTERTVRQILAEQELAAALQQELDGMRAAPEWPLSKAAIVRGLRARASESFPWALTPPAPSAQAAAYRFALSLPRVVPVVAVIVLIALYMISRPVFCGVLALGVAAAVMALGAFVTFLLVLVVHENLDDRAAVERGPLRFDPDHVTELGRAEDFGCQNHLASLIDVKAGIFRRATLWGVLFLVNILARFSKPGELSGIPSIHFAHWTMTNDGKRLLFLSNFDNSWGSYLDDFTDKAALGLTGVWTNTRDFPHTRLLVKEGAADGARFKIWARMAQCPTRVFYRAYPSLSVAGIERNTAIRAGLSQANSDEEISQWLKLF